MSERNETTILVLALLTTLGLVGGAIWWFTQDRIKLTDLTKNQTEPNTFAQVTNLPTGLFSYGGSTTWASIRGIVDPAIEIVHPEFRLRYTNPTSGTPGSGSGIKMLLDGQLAFAQSSRSIKEQELNRATARGFELKAIPVAIDGIAIAVHPNLNISGLTLGQLQEIYTGKLTNWQQLGGIDLPIVPYSRQLNEGGTTEFFAENVLNGADFGRNVQFSDTTTQALRAVAANPGGIYYASAPEIVSQCTVKPLPLGRKATELIAPYQQPFIALSQCPSQRNQVNTAAFQSGDYPITRRLFVIVKLDGNADQQAGEAYAKLLLTSQGQQLIAKAGFVSIR
ncbi:PstS family phosphate ABC transporter substrate-binding protein [Synechocystis sp. PCC 7509]|uniref:PstS family phosphate ABC transporter substrate-binding protein n=1 Tax=Synechocystis sp. PCC 7509 TaxID=927677 RepID=UPI0002AC0095|nr:PstS family phosphate ABC transporter substrate-binding protein [Synechocystis sp. PCC 7509]